MKKNYSDITIVLDRSGSMDSCRNDVIGGFNAFLDEQKGEEGEATISLYQFDDRYEAVYENRALADAPALTKQTFVPRGSTALFDAVGRTIVITGERYRAMPEEQRPEKVFFVIITDGEENSSAEYAFSRVKEMIEHQQEKYGWQFVFLGAELRAVEAAMHMGFKQSHVMNYAHTGDGYKKAYKSISKNITKMRAGNLDTQQIKEMDFFDDEDRRDQEDEKKKKPRAKRVKH